TPPKSKLIGQEDELQCALRVVPDVIGLNLSDIHIEEGFRAEIKYLSGDKPKRSIYYVARLAAKNARIETGGVGSMNILWWSSKQAQEKVFFKNMQDIISKATSFIELRQQARREAAAAASAASAENSPHLHRLHLGRRPGSGSSRGDVDRHGSRAGSDEETATRCGSGRGMREGGTHNGGGPDGRGSPLTSHSWRDGGAANTSGERTHAPDEGAGGGRNLRPSAAATAASNPMYKTRLCERDATDGNCPYGVRCIFAHGPGELRERTGPPSEVHLENTVGTLYKTKICERFVNEGHCQYGPRCNYAHGPSDLRERPAANHHHEGDRDQARESSENGMSRADGAGLLRKKVGETQPSSQNTNNGLRQPLQDHGFHPMLLKRGEPADERSNSKSFAHQTQRGGGDDLERHHHTQHPVQHVFAPHARHAAEHPESGFHPMLLKRGESLEAFLDPAATSSAARTAPALSAAHHHQHPQHETAPSQQQHQQPPPRVTNHSPGPGASLLSTFSRPRTPLTAPHTPPGPGKARGGAGGGRGDHFSHHQQPGSRKDLAGGDDKPWVHVVDAPSGARPSSGLPSTAAGGAGGGATNGGGGGLPTPLSSAAAPPPPPGERPAASALLEEKLAAALSKILLARHADSSTQRAVAASSISSSTLSAAPPPSAIPPATLAPPIAPSPAARPLTPADEIKELTRLEFKHDLSKRQVFGILFCALTHDGAYESARVRARADMFRQVVRSRADQELLIRTVEKKIEKSPEAVQAKFLAVVRDLYDTDLVEEDVLLAWFDGKHDHPQVAGRVAPFITWLRTAEEED
ncbi:nudix (nucleoside diphosphate linked moiety X)-type motif 2, partial [Geranomyces variabilis]